MNKKIIGDQRGFALLEVILIVLVLGVVGFVGFKAYQSKQAKPATTESQPIKQTTTDKTNPVPQDANTYMVITQWGVKVPQLPKGNILSYQISANDKNMADIVSSEQKALGGSCGEFSFARYHLYQSDTGKSNDEFLQNKFNYAAQNNQAIKANGKTYYIIGDMSGGDCTGTLKEGQSVSQQEVTANQHLLDSLKGLTAN